MSSESTLLLNDLVSRLERIWVEYLESGPGRLEPTLFDGVEAEAATLKELMAESREDPSTGELTEAIDSCVDLARRCVQRSEGLCFITGEAGLVPRRDLHQRYEILLERIRSAAGGPRQTAEGQ